MSGAATLADGRFVFEARLGSGSSGDVFRALDTHDGQRVALKRLQRPDVESIARFKAEFRAVAAIAHPNLVTLHGLHRDGDAWFLTMELIEGTSLEEHVTTAGKLDLSRVRSVFAGIVNGLGALHAHGHVHRDLKPSNVLVRNGRAIVLDFGLAAPPRARGRIGVVGSPRYVAPELCAGGDPTPASDWYSLGVMLHELVAGRPPFEGRSIEVLVQKRSADAPRLDHPLGSLIASLLDREPMNRPDRAAILAALDAGEAIEPALVGRQADLAWLGAAFDALRRGEPSRCVLVGEPGVGKSYLLRRFMRSLPRDVLLLYGRCYERELVPYKGMDAAIESLVDALLELPNGEVEQLVPESLPSLLVLFPALTRVPVFDARKRPVEFERQQLRTEALNALRELFGRLAQRRPLVLVLDDIQWGDRDAALLLHELLREPDPLPLLFVGAQRTGTQLSGLESLELEARELAPLAQDEAQQLARAFGAIGAAGEIALAAGGNPLLIELLARFGGEGATGLDEALRRSLDGVDEPTRMLMHAICLAGHPLERGVASKVAEGGRFEPLRHLGLIQDGERVEAYHDRIRETVVASLATPERTELHGRLADAMVDADGDPEAIAHHQGMAGRAREAARWTIVAARRAEDAFAWERAAMLYRRAEQLHAQLGMRRADLLVALGDALGNAGRGADADAAFRRALPLLASESSAHTPAEIWRRSAEHLLRIGRMDEGLAALDEATRIHGIRVPKHPASALAVLLVERGRLAVRGFDYVERSHVPSEVRCRIDLAFGAGVGLSTMDSLRGAGFLARSLREALDAGDLRLIARSMAYEASFRANQGRRGEARASALVRECEAIARRLDDAHLGALCMGARCLIDFHNARWRRAAERGREAEQAFRRDSVGMVKEVASIQLYRSVACLMLGEIREIDRPIDALVREALQRGDLFTQANLRTGFLNARWLARDDIERARREADAALREWDPGYYTIQRFFDFWARVQIDLYRGDGLAAGARARRGHRVFRRSLLNRLQFLRFNAWDLVGRAALSEGRSSIAHELGRRLLREGEPWADALGSGLVAGAARLDGNHRAAERALVEAIAAFDDLSMAAHSASARLRRAQWRGDPIDEAHEALRHLGISAPTRWARMLFPV